MLIHRVRRSFVLIVVVAVLAVVVLSYLFGAGYMTVVWLGWQIQSTASLFMLINLALLLFLLYCLFWVYQYKLKVVSRQHRAPNHVSRLYWFEQLGCYWLLDAQQHKQAEILHIFNHSSLLKQLVAVKYQRESGDIAHANVNLAAVPSAMQPLANLEAVQLLILAQRYEEAIDQLGQMSQQDLSDFIQSLQPAYQRYIAHLWHRIAMQVPWQVLDAQKNLDYVQHADVLPVMAQQVAQTSSTQQQQLIALYTQHVAEQPITDLAIGKSWLMLLKVLPEATQQLAALWHHLLSMQFDPTVFGQWLDWQIERQTLSDELVRQWINSYADKYPAQPIIAYAQWHVYQQSAELALADQLLNQWMQDSRFCYLRLKQSLSDQPHLLADLDVLYHTMKQ